MLPLPSALSLFRRTTRYARSFWWLLVQQYKAAPGAFVVTLLTGLLNKLGSVVVFIVTVKCSLWLLKPESIPTRVADFMGAFKGSTEFVGLLLALPPFVVISVALAGVLFARARMRVVVYAGDAIALAEGRKRIAEHSTERAKAVPRAPRFAEALTAEILDDWSALYRLQGNLIKLIVLVLTVGTAVLLAAYIDPIVTGVVMLFALCVSGFIVWRQHESSYSLNSERAQQRIETAERSADISKEIKQSLDQPSQLSGLEDAIRRHHRTVMAMYRTRERTDSLSRLGLDVAQSVMLFVMMLAIYIRDVAMNASEIAYALILLVVLRFAMSQVRAIVQTAMSLSKDYRRLVAIAGLAATGQAAASFHDDLLSDDY